MTRRLDSQIRSRPTPRQRLLVLVGPSGAGRTSLAAKLATRILLTGNRVRLISADGAVPGAPQKLRALAVILGCDHVTVEDPEELPELITDRAPDMLTIVDCPATVTQALSRWSSVLSRMMAPEIHLVVNATAKPMDIRSAIRRHAPLRPHRLACTHLDDTSTFGSVLGESMQAELPISFVSHGSAIPEDLAVPEIRQLLDLAFPDLALYGPHSEEQTT